MNGEVLKGLERRSPIGAMAAAVRSAIRGIVLLCLALALGLSAVACTGTDEAAPTSTSRPAAATTEADGGREDAGGSPGAEAGASTGAASTGASTGTASTGADLDEYAATDSSYTSAGTSISISTVATGSGRNTLTYYVADVRLSEGTDLLSAFSGGEYGGNAEDTSDIAAANDAILAVNGDYYLARDGGIIIRNGVLYRNEPARTGLALYEDGTMETYDENEVSAEGLLAAGVWNTFSFGPALLEDGAIVDGIESYEADADPEHPIQGANPRTGIGMIDANHFVLVVVDGRNPGYSRGVTLTELAQIFQELDCITAYNLDGGGSATMYFRGELVNQPAQKRGERSVSDILYVG